MRRTSETGPTFDKYTEKCKKKYRHIKGYISKIKADYIFVVNLLEQDLPIPDRFKDHKVDTDSFGNHIRELHLVSYNSDCLLVYKKYDNILYQYAITDHNGMNKILHGSVLLIDLPEETVDMILAGKLDY